MQEAIKQNARSWEQPQSIAQKSMSMSMSLQLKGWIFSLPIASTYNSRAIPLSLKQFIFIPNTFFLSSFTHDCFGPQNNNWSSRPEQALGGINLSTHSESSHLLTSYGHNWTFFGNSYTSPTPSIHTLQPLDSAYLKHTAHYYVTPPVRSNFIRQPLHLTYTHTSLWKIHTP